MSSKKEKRLSQKQQERAESRQKSARLQQFRVMGIGALGLLVVVALVLWRNAGSVPVDELTAVTPSNLIGSPTAPVKIVEYGDFGCTTCRAWHNTRVWEQLQAQFGDQISLEFRHLPVITAQSPKAAEAGQCAAEQGSFWPFHDYIYEKTEQGALSESDLQSYAEAVGLDKAAFTACLDSGKYTAFVAKQQEEALDLGARGTPSFFINGQPASFTQQSMTEQIQQALGQ